MLGADFNGHVGEGNRVDKKVMGRFFGVKYRNLEGQALVDFAKRIEMVVVNTYFQKREEQEWRQVHTNNYILYRRGNLREIRDFRWWQARV